MSWLPFLLVLVGFTACDREEPRESRTEPETPPSRVDEAQEKLREPKKVVGNMKLSDSAARDLVTALTGLLSAQNAFLNVWVDQEVQRLSLDFDLGTMQLNQEGMWIDPTP